MDVVQFGGGMGNLFITMPACDTGQTIRVVEFFLTVSVLSTILSQSGPLCTWFTLKITFHQVWFSENALIPCSFKKVHAHDTGQTFSKYDPVCALGISNSICWDISFTLLNAIIQNHYWSLFCAYLWFYVKFFAHEHACGTRQT